MKTQFFDSSYGKLAFWYHKSGSDNADTLLFVHGLPTSKELWTYIIEAPELQQFNMIAVDLNQYGESEQVDYDILHTQRADVLFELIKHLDQEKIVLISHDLGSSVAIDYLGKYEASVNKFVIMSPPVYPDFNEPAIVKIVRHPITGPPLIMVMKPLLFSIGITQGLTNTSNFTKQVKAGFSSHFKGKLGRKTLRRLLNWGRPKITFANYPEIIKSIAVPTLIVHGSDDPYIPVPHSKRLLEDIKDSKLVLIDNAAHFLPLDCPERLSKEILNFVTED